MILPRGIEKQKYMKKEVPNKETITQKLLLISKVVFSSIRKLEFIISV